MKNMRLNAIWLLTVYLLMVFTAYLYPINTEETVNRFYLMGIRGDYWLHCCLFMPLPFLIYQKSQQSNGKFFLWNTLSLLIAITAEGIHYMIPYRSFNPYDMFANAIGTLAGSVLTFSIIAYRRKHIL